MPVLTTDEIKVIREKLDACQDASAALAVAVERENECTTDLGIAQESLASAHAVTFQAQANVESAEKDFLDYVSQAAAD